MKMHTSTTRSHTQAFSSHDALIHDHLEIARRVARKLARKLPPSLSTDEVEGAALLGLTEAASRFDSSRGEPFIAYAVKRIRGAVLDELRRRARGDSQVLRESEASGECHGPKISRSRALLIDYLTGFRRR